MKRRASPPYWLARGDVLCHACMHLHVVESVVHCAACDRGVCTHCAVVVRTTSEVVCPACHAAEGN